jgi:hypothetical protein
MVSMIGNIVIWLVIPLWFRGKEFCEANYLVLKMVSKADCCNIENWHYLPIPYRYCCILFVCVFDVFEEENSTEFYFLINLA